MFRCSRYAPAAAAAALAAALCSAPSAGAAQVPDAAQAAATAISAGVPPTFTDLAFPAPATGWLLGQAAPGGRAEI